MNLTDHDNLATGAMPEPSKTQQEEYYRIYKEVEGGVDIDHAAPFVAKSRKIHKEVARRMGLTCKEAK